MINVSEEFCPAIIVMAKAPRPGQVKTRLQPFLDSRQAALLAACFLQDTVSKVKKAGASIIIGFTPADGRDELQHLLGDDFLWAPQTGQDLGDRMSSVIEYAESKEFSPIIVIGTDSPTLPLNLIQMAVEYFRLEETELVLGPSIDGGYYLIGLKKLISGIFENIEWSSSQVYRQTIENAARTAITKVKELPVWYDIDVFEDLFLLRDEIINNQEMQANVQMTYEWLLLNDLLFSSRNFS